MNKIFMLFFLIFSGIGVFGQTAGDFETEIVNIDGKQGIAITKYNGSARDVVIPEFINDIPVVAIKEGAFASAPIYSVKTPNSLIEIGYSAFKDCAELVSVYLGSGVTNMGRDISNPNQVAILDLDERFYGCTGLKRIDVDKANKKYSSIDGVLFNKGKTVLLFFPCAIEGNYTVPEGVTQIRQGAFLDCDKLNSVDIPSTVNNIETYNFLLCSSLRYINVSKNNTKYTSEDGVLFSFDKEKLIFFPPQKTGDYHIPDSVKVIGLGAFIETGADFTVYIDFSKIVSAEPGSLASFDLGESKADLEERFRGAFSTPFER